MIDIDLYRFRIGTYSPKCSKGLKPMSDNGQVTYSGGCISEEGGTLFLFYLFYMVFILYTVTVGMAMCTEIDIKLVNYRTSITETYPKILKSVSMYSNSIVAIITCRIMIINFNITSSKFFKNHVISLTLFLNIFRLLGNICQRKLDLYTFLCNFISVASKYFKRKIHIINNKTIYSNLSAINLQFSLHYLKTHCVNIATKIIINAIVWISFMNLVLVIIANPSITNPGPRNNNNNNINNNNSPHKASIEQLQVFYQNVQGLIPIAHLNNPNPSLNVTKLLELQSYIYYNKPDIVVLNETWLKPNICNDEILPSDSYNVFRLDRSLKSHPTDPMDPKKYHKNGGGVLIATRADLSVTVKQINIKCAAEILGVQLNFSNGQKFIVCTLYRVGTLGIENYAKVESYLQTICKRRGINNIVVLGDMNLNKTNWTTLNSTCDTEQSFLDLFSDLALTQIINQPTHIKGNTLDIVLTKLPQSISNMKILDIDVVCKSDHNPISFNLKAKISRTKSHTRQIYNFSKANWTGLNEDLAKVNWRQKLHNTGNIEHIWMQFKNALFENINKHIPKIKIRSEFQPPWFDSETYELCRKKERLRAKFKCTRSDECYIKFSSCRRELKQLIKQKMNDNFSDDCSSDHINKKFWSYVKSSNNTHRIPNSVNYNGCHRTDSAEQAELFNKFFYDQFSDESTYDIPIDDCNLNNQLFNIQFDHMEICKLLRQINPNKAHGPDGIHGMILKKCAATLSYPLSTLFRASYNSGQIPNDWKLANVVPIHKKGSKNSVENYRPISLTSLVMKQYEKIIRVELMTICENKIQDCQHGFLPYKSCTTQMINFTDSLAVSLNENCHIDVIYFDFAKAFDTVNHDLLLQKLKYLYNVDGPLIRFLINYLKDRKQQVVVGNSVSSICNVNSGVPQGSIIGPILFVLFINDISENLSEGSNLALYADDTKLWREIQSTRDHEILQNDILSLQTWARKNKMKFHPSKCHVLPISRKRLPPVDKRFRYHLNGIELDYCSSETDLGVIVTSKLNFTDHCNKLYSKATARLGLNKRTCHFITNSQCKRKIYLTMVRSLFEHCSVIWRPHNQTTKDKLENVQKRAVKWILDEEYKSYSDLEYLLRCKQLNFLPLDQKFLYNDLLLFHKAINSLSPVKLPDYLYFFRGNSRLRSTHLDPLSLVSKITPKICAKYHEKSISGTECKIFENSYFYRSHLSWNKLPLEIRETTIHCSFKTKLRKYLWDEALRLTLLKSIENQ